MKKTLALFLAMMAVFAFGVCAVTLDTAENAAEVAAEETAVLAAVELKPGLNVYTGTTNPYTFDDETLEGLLIGVGVKGNKPAVVVKEKTTGDGNKALAFTERDQYVAVPNFAIIEADRPIKYSVKYIYTGQIRLMATDTYDYAKKSTHADLDYIYHNQPHPTTWQTKNVTRTANVSGGMFNGEYVGKDIEQLYLYMYSEIQNSKTISYIDDISVIPYYKLTYDVNGGTGADLAPEYFYVEDGAGYAVKASGEALTKDGKAFAGWALTADATPNDVIDKLYPVPGSDVVLYAVYGEAVKPALKPGLNIFTGTTNALTFEGDEKYLSKYLTNGAVVGADPNGENLDNHSLKFTKQAQYIAVRYFPESEADRPFSVKLDVNYQSQVRVMDIDVFDHAQREYASPVVIYANNKKWHNNLSYTIYGTQTASAGTGDYYTDDFCGDAFKNLFVYSYNGATAVDNLNITPYYKLNFEVNGGTGTVAPEYFLVAEGASYTIKTTAPALTKGDESFCGWALTADATSDDIVTAVTPKLGEDITLYAVYNKPVTVTLIKDGAQYAKYDSAAGKEITVNGSYFADADNYYVNWQTEDGKAVIANKYTFEDSATLTAVKYARKMTIGENAFSNGDFEEDYVEVRATAGNLFIVEDDAEHGNVLKYQRINSGYGSIQRGVIWETSRMYRLEYDVKTLSTGTTSSWNTIYGGADHAHNGPKTVAGEWVHESHDFQHTATDAAQISDVITFYMNPLPAGVENVIYYDNLKLIPYHKVTFNANGAEGTAPAIDWTLAKTYEITAGAGEMVKDGFYLAGWALTADGEAVASVDTVVGEDIELFAVWAPVADENAPESDEESFSMRAGDKAGMRFYASVTAAQRNEATEYGFVAARADILNAIGVNAAELNLGLTYNGAGEGKLFVKGAAYIKDGDNVTLDKYLEETDDGGVIYAAVCTGLDITNKTQVTTQFVLRPYINIGGVYAYGKPVVKSLYEVAASIDTTELPAEIVEYINTIIATATAE